MSDDETLSPASAREGTFMATALIRTAVVILAASAFLRTPLATAQTFLAFGLTNRAIGNVEIDVEGGGMTIANNGASGVVATGERLPPGTFGVSIETRDAASGIWAYPYHNGYFNGEEFLVGHAFGEVNGEADRPICALRARRQYEGVYIIEADFSRIGSVAQVFELYGGDTLLARATNTSGGAYVYVYGQSGPRANPFVRLPDGGVGAVVEMSEMSSFTLPNDSSGYGNRLLIRALGVTSEVKSVSRVDVTGGNGLTHFLITEGRPGYFGHPHLALGPTVFAAGDAQLGVAKLQGEELAEEHGVTIELNKLRSFNAGIAPLQLETNASIIASAVGRIHGVDGEFLGYAGVRNTNGALEVFASLPVFDPQVEIAVYHRGCLMGAALAPSSLVVAGIAGTPDIVGLGATANTLQTRAGFVVRFDAPTTFALPGGSSFEGTEIRFRAVNAGPIERLTGFSLVASGLPSFTIVSETSLQTININDYLTDLQPASLKRFIADEGLGIVRRVSITNRAGQSLIQVNDASSNQVSAELFSLQAGDLYYHGNSSPEGEEFSISGIRLLPEEVELGKSYAGHGSFVVSNYTEQADVAAYATATDTRVAGFELVTVPAGTFRALLIQSGEEHVLSTPIEGAPPERLYAFRQYWLVEGIGVVKFYSSDHHRLIRGELAAYNVIASQPRDQTVNVGAAPVFEVNVQASGLASNAVTFGLRRNGTLVSSSGSVPPFILPDVTLSNAGHYTVTVSNDAGVVTSPLGFLKVVPFSDPACFWARRAGGTAVGFGQTIHGSDVALDAEGNVYVVGAFTGPAAFGPFTLTSAGSSYDIFITKLSPAGQFLWAVRAGGANYEVGLAIGLDIAGNVYIAGAFEQTTTLGSNTLISAGSSDVFVAKLDGNGNFLWAVRGGSSEYDVVSDLEVDAAGEIYVTGTFHGGSGRFGGFFLPGVGYYNSYFVKLNPDGGFVWARSIPGASPAALALEPGGEIYMTGTVVEPAVFDGTTVRPRLNRAVGFLARANTNGTFAWAKALGHGEGAQDVAVDLNGNVFVTGKFSGLANFGPIAVGGDLGSLWNPEVYLAKLNASGDFLWARKSGAPLYTSSRVAVDGAGNAYLFGQFYSFAEVGSARLYGSYSSGLVSKIDPLGHPVWSRQFSPGAGDLRVVVADASGNVYLSGSFGQSARFGDFILNSPIQGSTSYNNLFVAKFCSPAPPVITAQPQSLMALTGSNALFSVTASNIGPLTYQWCKGGVSIPEATNDNLLLVNVQFADAADYSVVVSGDGGAVNSTIATLTVVTPNAGTLAFSGTTYVVGEPEPYAVIEIMRSGSLTGFVTVEFTTEDGTATAGLDFMHSAGTLRFADGESSKLVSVPIMNERLFEDDETAVLRLCQPRGGATLGTISNATLVITNDDSPAPFIVTHPRNRGVSAGTTVTFSVGLSGLGPFQYQWRKNGVSIPGANAATYTVASAQVGDAGNYSVFVTSDYGEALSRNAVLTVYPLPAIVQQPQNQTVERWASVTLRVLATAFNTTTQIFNRFATSDTEDLFVLDTAGLAGRLIIDWEFFQVPDSLRVYNEGSRLFDTGLTNGAGSVQIFYAPVYYSSGAVEVVVNEGAINYPGTAWLYNLQIIPDTLRYEWRKDGVIIPGAVWSTLTIPSATTNDAGQYVVTVMDQLGAVVVSQPVTLTVVPPTAPPLLISRRADGTNGVYVSWGSPHFYLEAAAQICGPWGYIATEGSALLIDPDTLSYFFRLRENPRPPSED